ncbi:MAG: methionyl-tRNA formyltransferase [Deltaproteobacteria bacterium]|nr:methionyl-tRNA formyltransferase [Deltaproteobacteria bacterium]
MKIVFMGSAAFAVPSLLALLESNHDIVEVVTQPDKPAGRGMQVHACPVAEIARERGIPLFQPAKIRSSDIIQHFEKLHADLFVVVAYGKLLPQALLDLPPKGCINVHASLLPKYRGAAPINWAVINGEHVTGVTTMYLSPEMDEGDIIMSISTKVDECITAEDLYTELSSQGAELLLKTVEAIENDSAPRTPQNQEDASYAPILTRENGHLDWKLSAQELYNRVRGLKPWPGAFTFIDGKRLTIHEAAPITTPVSAAPGTILSTDGQLSVATGDGQLYLLEVQLEGKKRMPTVDFLRGFKMNAGDRLE